LKAMPGSIDFGGRPKKLASRDSDLRDDCCCVENNPKTKWFLAFAFVMVMLLQISTLSFIIVTSHHVKVLESEERKFIHSGFFPKIMHALEVAHSDKHFGPLKQIFGGVGNLVSSWFSPSKRTARVLGHAERLRRDLHESGDFGSGLHEDARCVFNYTAFISEIDSLYNIIERIDSGDEADSVFNDDN